MTDNNSAGINDQIKFVDYYQTPLNAGTYKITAKLTAPEALKDAAVTTDKTIKLHVAGPRFFLPPAEIHSVFPPENGVGDYNNVLPHVVLNRRTLPWERLVCKKNNDDDQDFVLEKIPFLALLVFTEDEEANGDVTPPNVVSLKDLGYLLEPGEKLTDKVNVISVKRSLLEQIIPTGEELCLLAHGRERTEHTESGEVEHQRAVVIANRLPAPPLSGKESRRNIAHLVMLENRYEYDAAEKEFKFASDMQGESVRLVSLKSWQFTCSADKPTLRGRLLGDTFTFESFCVPKTEDSSDFEQLRMMSYAALPYHLRWGDRTHTLYHGPLVAVPSNREVLDEVSGDDLAPASADGLVRLLKNERIFDVSLAVAWQLGRMLMLRDQSVAMAYFAWRRRDAQLRARESSWERDAHLQPGDDFHAGLSPIPKTVRDWCQDRLALRGIPFEYLVPDTRMLPENSLRIFQIHESWMECLLSGALALGRAGEADRRHEATYRSAIFPPGADARNWTGFLLRSPSVEEHPDLVVAASAIDGSALTKVRLERIGTGLFFGLFTGMISKLEFSLPSIGLHFGLKEDANKSFAKDLRNEDGSENAMSISVPMRPVIVVTDAHSSVVDVSGLSDEMMKARPGESMSPGKFAFQMCEGTEAVEFMVKPDVGS